MKTLYAAALTALFTATLAHGDIIAVSNLGEITDGDTLISENLYQATSFTTGNLPGGYELSSIGFQYGTGGAEDGKVNLFLFSSDFDAPGGALTGGSAPAGAADEIKYVDLSWSLDPNTQYFVVLHGSVNNEGIRTTSSSNETPGDIPTVGVGWDIGNSRWTKAGANGWSTVGGANPFKIRVNVVPEPSVHLLILTGGGFVFVGHRWRTRAKGKQEESS